MVVYLDVVILLNFFVDFLLLLGTNRLAGYPPGIGKAAGASLLGGIYGGLCLLPGLSFLGSLLWRIAALCLMARIAFGSGVGALRRGVLFVLLSMALGGVALGLGKQSIFTLIPAAAGVAALCALGLQGKTGKQFVPVELSHEGKTICLTALRDTGNDLRDPLTGQQMLVIGPSAAQYLTGLTRSQLRDPAGSLGALPGLRLVPFRTVGTDRGMLLALKLQRVKIGTWQGSGLVAFAPEGLENGEYEALTGGAV